MTSNTYISLDDLRHVVEETCLGAGLTPLRAKQEADGNLGRLWRVYGSRVATGFLVPEPDVTFLLDAVRGLFLKGRKPPYKEVNDALVAFFNSKK